MSEATAELNELKRPQLDALAVEEGIPEPKAYNTKEEVVTAIEAVRNGQPVPPPPEQSKAAAGATVTFTGCEDHGVRSVRAGDFRFLLNTPVHGVDKATVESLGELDGYEFTVE